MAREKTPSFIHTLSLAPELWQANIITNRFEAGRALYNACLGELLKRHTLMIESKRFRAAIKAYRIAKKEGDKKKLKELSVALLIICVEFGFTEYSIHTFVSSYRHSQFENLTDAHTSQKIATRAFKATNEYHFGKRGKPRFKRFGQIKSLEGKSNVTSIRFVNGKMLWGKLSIPVENDHKDRYGIEANALLSEVKYCRVVVKQIRTKPRYFLQLILKGTPKEKPHHLEARAKNIGKIVGIDLGPQSIAVVSAERSTLRILAPEIDRIIKQKAALQRKLSRKLRLSNPNNYEPDRMVKKDKKIVKKIGKSKPKKDCKVWIRTNAYTKLRKKIAELERVQTSRRRESHNGFINHLLTLGSEFKLEKLNYKAWQKMFGKSIGAKAPGLLVERLRRKAENAGGSVAEFETRTTRLSQTCLCGTIKKKSLNERWHICECGLNIQRDLLSGYLAMFVEHNTLDLKTASNCFSGVEHSLQLALLNLKDLSSSEMKTLGIKYSEIENLANLMSTKNPIVVEDVVAYQSARATNLVGSILEPSSFMAR